MIYTCIVVYVIYMYCYKKYVNDILIIFDHNKINETTIIDYVNKVLEHLEFKALQEID